MLENFTAFIAKNIILDYVLSLPNFFEITTLFFYLYGGKVFKRQSFYNIKS